MALRRHPSGPHLGAWFDGEQTDETVGPHVARCSRCHRRLSEMARVRAWIRAQPFFAMGDEPAATAPLRRWRPLLTAAAVVLVALLLGPGAPRAARTGGE
ncbi:MAG: hypothetical protein M3N31_02965, partial [Actinomycetota bacterium]|nr:hypothetical protein [Actinomycetota bacterium]